jgi:hypothetical protein
VERDNCGVADRITTNVKIGAHGSRLEVVCECLVKPASFLGSNTCAQVHGRSGISQTAHVEVVRAAA